MPGVKKALKKAKASCLPCLLREKEKVQPISLTMDSLTEAERSILLAGALMNYYANEGNNPGEREEPPSFSHR